MSHSSTLAILLAVLIVAAIGVLVAENRSGNAQAGRHPRGAPGFGTATDLGPCLAAFDSRLEERCGCDLNPIPGGGWFCERHGHALVGFSLRGGPDRVGGADANPP